MRYERLKGLTVQKKKKKRCSDGIGDADVKICRERGSYPTSSIFLLERRQVALDKFFSRRFARQLVQRPNHENVHHLSILHSDEIVTTWLGGRFMKKASKCKSFYPMSNMYTALVPRGNFNQVSSTSATGVGASLGQRRDCFSSGHSYAVIGIGI